MSSAGLHEGSLVERERETAALECALAERGRLVVIEGPPGIGKTSLLGQALARAQRADMLVASATGTALERQVAFGVVRQLLAPVVAAAGADRAASLLGGGASPARRLSFRGAPAGPDSSHDADSSHNADSSHDADSSYLALDGSPDAGEGMIEGLYWLTESLAAGADGDGGPRPLVLGIDDAHWSDEGSSRFVARLVSHLSELDALVVLAVRPHEPGAATIVGELAGHPQARLLRPGPLTEAGTAHLVRAVFPEAEASFAPACSHATGGNPFFLTALLDDLVAEGVPATAETAAGVGRFVPSTAARSILVRLARLPETAVRLAHSVAVLGDRTPLDRAAALSKLDPESAEEAADVLAGAHLLQPGDPLSFTHPLIGVAISEDVPAFARARVHRQAAELLADSGAQDAVVAAHLLACRSAGDPWVVKTLCAAASTATAAGEHQAASRFLARAIEEPPGPAELAEIEVVAALARAANAESGALDDLTAVLGLIADPARHAAALLALARLLILRGDFAGAATAAEQGLDHADPEHSVGQALLAELLIAASRDPARRQDALRRFEPLVDAARAGRFPDDAAMCARLASRMASAGEDRSTVAELARRALAGHALVDPNGHGAALAFVAAGIYWIGELVWCQQTADAALDAAQRQGTPVGVMAASHWQAAASCQLGRLDEAVVSAERSLAVARDEWGALAGWTGAILAVTQVQRGDLAGARRALSNAERVDRSSMDWAFLLAARAGLGLAEGDASGAWADSLASGAHLAEVYHIDNPAVMPWRSLAALAGHRLGRDDEADELARRELDQARRLDLPLPLGNALWITGTVTAAPDALDLLEEAVAVLRRSPAPLAFAYALVSLGSHLRQQGWASRARKPLGKALALAGSSGAERLRDRAEQELHAAGGRRPRSALAAAPGAALTPTQQRVASLAAGGLSNPEIAQRLYVTTKTVEWHLGAIYRELGIARRDQLTGLVGGR